MKDITDSLDRALRRQGWLFGDRWSRTGSPFVWVDGNQMLASTKFLQGPYGVLQGLAMYYEDYPTLDDVRTDDHADVAANLERRLESLLQSMAMQGHIEDFRDNITLTARTRAQDYSFIKRYAIDLPVAPAHLDLGPGLGTHALYSIDHLKGGYTGVETSDFFYEIQRNVFRSLASSNIIYYDPIIDETLEVPLTKIDARLASAGQSSTVTHVPCWYFESVPRASQDLVTATFMLNETAPAGISWLLAHSISCLKPGGYFYIRDSRRLKPNRHQLNYDNALQELGFAEVKRLDIRNRVDMFGLPRLYQKLDSLTLTFEEVFERYFGREAVTVHQGEYMQNVAVKSAS